MSEAQATEIIKFQAQVVFALWGVIVLMVILTVVEAFLAWTIWALNRRLRSTNGRLDGITNQFESGGENLREASMALGRIATMAQQAATAAEEKFPLLSGLFGGKKS